MSNEKIQPIHRGQALKKAVYESGIKIAVLARKIEKSRRFIYLIFDNKDVPLHLMRSVCEAIKHPFTRDMFEDKLELEEELPKDYWKDKYLKLLEEHNSLLKTHYEQH
jgi:hypothetical protein